MSANNRHFEKRSTDESIPDSYDDWKGESPDDIDSGVDFEDAYIASDEEYAAAEQAEREASDWSAWHEDREW